MLKHQTSTSVGSMYCALEQEQGTFKETLLLRGGETPSNKVKWGGGGGSYQTLADGNTTLFCGQSLAQCSVPLQLWQTLPAVGHYVLHVCHNCKGTEHWARDCPQNKVGLQAANVLD